MLKLTDLVECYLREEITFFIYRDSMHTCQQKQCVHNRASKLSETIWMTKIYIIVS